MRYLSEIEKKATAFLSLPDPGDWAGEAIEVTVPDVDLALTVRELSAEEAELPVTASTYKFAKAKDPSEGWIYLYPVSRV